MMGLRGEPVLVTGANGFVGGALASHLIQQGARVRGLVRSGAKGAALAARGADPVIGDLRDSAALHRAVQDCTIVFHVGAALHGPAAVQYDVNVTGVRRLVEAAHAAGVRRLVHVSTIAVYGYDRPGILREDVPPRPGADYYAQSKALGERVLFERADALGLDVVVLRPGMIYGPGSGMWTGRFFDLVKRPPAPLPGRGSAYLPVIYIDDLLDLMVVAAEHPDAVGQVFNAVSDEAVTWRAFLEAYAAMAGHQAFVPVPAGMLRVGAALLEPVLRLYFEPQPVRQMVEAFAVRRRAYSMNKAARLLGWRPHVPLADGMAQTELWLRETGRLA